jgi:hypothetical protein
MPTLAHVDADQGLRGRTDLLRVITAEYREMPGLSVTVEQAARLWQADRRLCLEVLEELTTAGFLYRCRERYISSAGRRF